MEVEISRQNSVNPTLIFLKNNNNNQRNKIWRITNPANNKLNNKKKKNL